MAFTDFDPAQPDGSVDNGSAALADLRNNQGALRVYLLAGLFYGYAYAQSGGTAAQPTTITLTKGTTIVRFTLTWGTTGGETNQPKTALIEVSTNSGSSWDSVGTITNTYDAGGELTATSGGGGLLSKLWSLWGLVRKVIADLAGHAAASGTAVHGLGTMATQAATNVNVDGGTIDGATIGDASPVKITAKTYRGRSLVPSPPGATYTLDFDEYDFYSYGLTGNVTLSLSATIASNTVAQGTVEMLASGAARTVTWPASVKWVGGAPPSAIPSGKTHVYQLYRQQAMAEWRGVWLGEY